MPWLAQDMSKTAKTELDLLEVLAAEHRQRRKVGPRVPLQRNAMQRSEVGRPTRCRRASIAWSSTIVRRQGGETGRAHHISLRASRLASALARRSEQCRKQLRASRLRDFLGEHSRSCKRPTESRSFHGSSSHHSATTGLRQPWCQTAEMCDFRRILSTRWAVLLRKGLLCVTVCLQ